MTPALPNSQLPPAGAETAAPAAAKQLHGPEASNAGNWSPSTYWLLVPVAVCAVLVLALMRTAGRLALRAGPVPVAQERKPGLEPASLPALRLQLHRDVGGQVRDLHSDKPLPQARIELVGKATGTHRLEASEDGVFRCRGLKPGELQLRASAPGYAQAQSRIRIPHRGEWTDMRIRLETLRSKALRSYRALALTLLPARHLWSIWTPRETLNNAGGSPGVLAALEELTGLVERACYDRRPPTEAEIDAIEKQVASTARQLQQTRPGAVPPHRR